LTGIKGGGGGLGADDNDDEEEELRECDRLDVGTGKPGRGDAPIQFTNTNINYFT